MIALTCPAKKPTFEGATVQIQPISVGPISPFFIVSDATVAATFYERYLGFDIRLTLPATKPFFAIVGRGETQILLKAISEQVSAQPNPSRHPWAAWDAFVQTPDPNALARDFTNRGTVLTTEPHDREDGLHGFEVTDSDGYVLFFGHPK